LVTRNFLPFREDLFFLFFVLFSLLSSHALSPPLFGWHISFAWAVSPRTNSGSQTYVLSISRVACTMSFFVSDLAYFFLVEFYESYIFLTFSDFLFFGLVVCPIGLQTLSFAKEQCCPCALPFFCCRFIPLFEGLETVPLFRVCQRVLFGTHISSFYSPLLPLFPGGLNMVVAPCFWRAFPLAISSLLPP